MNKFCAFALIAAAVSLSAATAQAMPFGSNQTQNNLVVPIAGGLWSRVASYSLWMSPQRLLRGSGRRRATSLLRRPWLRSRTMRRSRRASSLRPLRELPDGLQLLSRFWISISSVVEVAAITVA